jgi:hypothetical protein
MRDDRVVLEKGKNNVYSYDEFKKLAFEILGDS